MKACKRIFALLFAATLLLGALPVYAANSEPVNGSYGLWSEFDDSGYDAVTSFHAVNNNQFDWPSSGTVLVVQSGSNWGSKLDSITVPAGLVVDFYQYHKQAGESDYMYELLARVDTTDGTARSAGASDASDSAGTSEEVRWNEVVKQYTPGAPSDSYSNQYTDVSADQWYYHPVMTLSEGGLLNGYGDGRFGPNDALTKGQVELIFIRMLGNTPVGVGTDKDIATRAYAAIQFAGRLGVSDGSSHRMSLRLTDYEKSLIGDAGGLTYTGADGRIYMTPPVYDHWRASLDKDIDYIATLDEIPDAAATRQYISENWLELRDMLILPGYPKDAVCERAENAIVRAYNLGMLSGVDEAGTFSPYSPLTRGQLAQILYNMGWTEAGCFSYSDETMEWMKEENERLEEYGFDFRYEAALED